MMFIRAVLVVVLVMEASRWKQVVAAKVVIVVVSVAVLVVVAVAVDAVRQFPNKQTRLPRAKNNRTSAIAQTTW